MKRCKKTIRYRFKKSFFFHAYLLLKDRKKRLSFKKKFPMSRTAQIKAKMAWLLYGLHANISIAFLVRIANGAKLEI